ncbi:glutamate mutase L [Desulfosporosinus youngiae]|uniref:glutamate mutase L n=1 Tax=Desulfosporosinus youngiae TaxID=339862 RepID=UPI000318B6AA|nr:glutamate mutase L [Desulfosporosinus youngiae]
MPYVLGIDTGGTYTDGVLLDFEGRTVVKKAKAFTTRQDLTIGIRECIDNLGMKMGPSSPAGKLILILRGSVPLALVEIVT